MTLGCKECGFTGVIEKDNKLYECICSFNSRVLKAMPFKIQEANPIIEHAAHPVVDMVRKNLFVHAAYDDMRSIIKAIMYKHHNLFIKVTNDAEILSVAVGSKSRKSRGDDAKVVYNDIEDFVEPPDLLIIEFGVMKYKNKAFALFEQAVNVRIGSGYLWLFSDIDKPFGPGSQVYSEELWKLIHSSSFKQVNIPRVHKAESFTAASPTRHMESQSSEPLVSVKEKTSKSKDLDEKIEDNGLGMFGAGIPKKKYRHD